MTCLIIFVFFLHTLNYPWRFFDEDIIFNETMLPIPANFQEIFEIIKSFGLNNHFEASNPFYSNISNIRGTPIDVLFCLFVFWLCKKSAYAYHLFSLLFHLLNSCLFFLILNKISIKTMISHKAPNYFRLFSVSTLTLIWALHPVNIESVLFATNFGAPVTYFFCLSFLFYFICTDERKTLPIIHSIIIFFLYLFSIFLNEYTVTLPFIILFYLSISTLYNKGETLKNSFSAALKKTTPLFLALFAYMIYFFSTSAIRTNHEESLLTTIERIFWLSPQIFFHFLKLVFFPAKLSIDQSALVEFPNYIFHPYAVFCCLFTYLLVISSFASIFLTKRVLCYLGILFIPFFLSLAPFLQLISPVYNLASERYLYFPLLLLILGIAYSLFSSTFNHLSKTRISIIAIFLVIALCTFSARAFTRTLDWKDSVSLLTSAIETAPNNLYKGLRKHTLATSIIVNSSNAQPEETFKYNNEAFNLLEKATEDFKIQEAKYQKKLPEVIKFYGLDPETLEAKTKFLLAYIKFDTTGDFKTAFDVFSPYIDKISPPDTYISDFYYKILFNTKHINDAENLLLQLLNKKRISPFLFVALSDLYEYKYNDLNSTNKFLHESFKLFPYDPLTLFGLKRYYQKLNDLENFAFFSYLLGLRTHDLINHQQAASVYISLNKKDKAKNIILKLSKNYPIDQNTLTIEAKYVQNFGSLTR